MCYEFLHWNLFFTITVQTQPKSFLSHIYHKKFEKHQIMPCFFSRHLKSFHRQQNLCLSQLQDFSEIRDFSGLCFTHLILQWATAECSQNLKYTVNKNYFLTLLEIIANSDQRHGHMIAIQKLHLSEVRDPS